MKHLLKLMLIPLLSVSLLACQSEEDKVYERIKAEDAAQRRLHQEKQKEWAEERKKKPPLMFIDNLAESKEELEALENARKKAYEEGRGEAFDKELRARKVEKEKAREAKHQARLEAEKKELVAAEEEKRKQRAIEQEEKRKQKAIEHEKRMQMLNNRLKNGK
ncbi:MAG: hypothetical protein LBS40_07350 [Burkholderiales bacterium]|jgi:hypothetical protein|nr:hypothetical protein [Burkholderiales bacterium]